MIIKQERRRGKRRKREAKKGKERQQEEVEEFVSNNFAEGSSYHSMLLSRNMKFCDEWNYKSHLTQKNCEEMKMQNAFRFDAAQSEGLGVTTNGSQTYE